MRVETCEELTNQEIFDLAMRKEVEEDKVETQADFNEDDFNDLNKIKKKVEKKYRK